MGTPVTDPQLIMFREAVRAQIRRDLAREREAAESMRREVLPVLEEVVAAARAEGVCARVWLFGSYAWGQPTAASDLDLLVEGDADEVAWRVGRATRREVDAWTLHKAPPELVTRACAEGIPL